MTRFFTICTLCLLGLAQVFPRSAVADEIYRCEGEGGRAEFQQVPCADKSIKPLELSPQVVDWVAAPRLKSGSAGGSKAKKSTRSRGSAAARKRTATAEKCWRNEQKLERIQWKLRKGYRPAEGERLKQRRRELEAYGKRFCR
ncbi:MAG: DUF4124 domain-containing protein [Candidatus Sedimenticola sp. PURPLELP]